MGRSRIPGFFLFFKALIMQLRFAAPVVLGSVLFFSFTFLVQAAPLADPLINGGFEQAFGTTTANTPGTVANDWQAYQNGYTRVNSNAHSGSWAIQLQNTTNTQVSGAYQRIDINQTSVKPVFIGGYAKGNSIAKNGTMGASLYVEVFYTDGTVGYWNSTPNFGTFNYRWLGFNTASAMFLQNSKPISHIFIIPILGNAAGTAYFDDLSVTEYDPTQAAVTIMIDDGETNTYTNAFPILSGSNTSSSWGGWGGGGWGGQTSTRRNMPASVAIPSSFIGTSGHMTQSQLSQLKQAGWEIMSHGKTHEDLTLMTTAQATDEINGSKARLQQLGFTVKNIAYPFGAYNGEILGISQGQYTSGRAFEQGLNPQGTFPFEVKVRAVINTTTLAQLKSWLEEARNKRQWLVLAFHSIANSGDDQYYTTPTQFRSFVDAIEASRIPVKTYDQALTQFKAAK